LFHSNVEKKDLQHENQQLQSRNMQDFKVRKEEVNNLLHEISHLRSSTESKDLSIAQFESKITALNAELIAQSTYHKNYISTIHKDLEEVLNIRTNTVEVYNTITVNSLMNICIISSKLFGWSETIWKYYW